MRAKAVLLGVCLALSPLAATGQQNPAPPKKPPPAAKPVPPILRYNAVSETMFLLERCGALTSERRAWLENVRGHAARATEWGTAQLAAHDAEILAEFRGRYPSVEPWRCDELARNVDNERASTIKVPLS